MKRKHESPTLKYTAVILSEAKDLRFFFGGRHSIQRCFASLIMTVGRVRRGVEMRASLDVGNWRLVIRT